MRAPGQGPVGAPVINDRALHRTYLSHRGRAPAETSPERGISADRGPPPLGGSARCGEAFADGDPPWGSSPRAPPFSIGYSSPMSTLRATTSPTDPSSILRVPSAEAWAAMSASDRFGFISEATAALQQQADLMSESSPHVRGKHRAFATLRDHFAREGRTIYVNMELPILYPEEPPFSPDLFAVLEVVDPGEDDKRRAWVVAEEGCGLDLVLEVTVHDDRKKDLVDNVERYARLGITEYFIFDRLRCRVIGYRQAWRGAPYRPIAQRGRWLASTVLGLNLGMSGEHLAFAVGESEVYGSAELVERLNRALEGLTQRAEAEAAALAEAERRAEAEALRRVDAERQAAAQAGALAEAERRIAELLARLGEG